jgi:hypothetical protein
VLRGAALEPGATAVDTLGLFLLTKGWPGRHFVDADNEAARKASFGLFLLPRGWPHPRFSISTLLSRLAAPASAIGKLCLVERENPR